MKKLVMAVSCLMAAGFLASGCWATMGNVQKELAKTKTEINSEQTKQTDTKIDQVYKSMDGINAKLEKDYTPKLNNLQTELYNLKQDMTKVLEERLATLTKELNGVKEWIRTFETANKEDVIKLAQDLRIAANVFRKQLESQKDGIERAINELEKLSLPTPEGVPEKTPPPPEKTNPPDNK